MKKRLFLTAMALALSAIAAPAAAQLGKQQIRMVVPAPPGSAPDVIARLVADQLRAKFGPQVLVENKPGAGGIMAVNAAKANDPKHMTLLFGHAAAMVVTPLTYKEANYDIARDFEVVGVVADTPMLFAANVDKGPKTWREAIDTAKAKPEAMTLANPNRTTIPHLAGELAGQITGAKFRHIPMGTTAQGLQTTVNGDALMYVDGATAVLPLVKAGRLRALAVTAPREQPGLEGIPLARDVVPGLDVSGWFMLVAKKNTPQPELQKLNAAINEIISKADVKEKFRVAGVYPVGGSLADAARYLAHEKTRWADVIRQSGLTPE